MNRRSFLMGCAAALASGLPVGTGATFAPAQTPEAVWRAWFAQWVKDVLPVLSESTANTIIFGCGGTRSCDKYPFVESIPADDLRDIYRAVDRPNTRGILIA